MEENEIGYIVRARNTVQATVLVVSNRPYEQCHLSQFFATTVNRFLIDNGVLDIHTDRIVGMVVDTGCAYFSSIAFPDTVHAGLRVAKLGNSSGRYELALYRNNDERPAAAGHFVQV